jgi:pilus assembly protein Flp/PilA
VAVGGVGAVARQNPDTDARRCERGKVVNLQLLWQYLQLRLVRDEAGASLVEYALLVALIAVVCIAAIALIGNSASTQLSGVGNSIATSPS